ncbi:retrovirus-related pol polyprotein from transposon TNT 1-94 [Tanacetum coccineum]
MSTLAEFIFVTGKENGRMMLNSIKNGPLIWPIEVDEQGNSRVKKYEELSAIEKLQADCDLRAANIILQGLPPDERQVQNYAGNGTQGNATSMVRNNVARQGKVIKCYNCQGEGHMARQCTRPKQPRNTAWFQEKLMLAQAQKNGQVLDEEQLAFLADLRIPDG